VEKVSEILEEGKNYRISYDGENIIAQIKGGRMKFKNGLFIVAKAPSENKKVSVELVKFVIESFKDSPSLMKFALESESTMKLVKYLYAYYSKSRSSVEAYISVVKQFCEFLGKGPDEVISLCFSNNKRENSKNIKKLEEKAEEFLTEQEVRGLTRTTVVVNSAKLKTFFLANGIRINLGKRKGPRVTFKDRAPKPEEVQKLIDIAPLREKVIIAMLTTGGFRIGTLLKLKYKDVKEDLEAGRIPLHIHVPAEYNKGKVCDYDTFINEEAVHYLKLYLEQRREGTDKIPPEEINDESPLFRTNRKEVKPLDKKTVEKSLHSILKVAGLRSEISKRHEVRIHSLRKFFRTQLVSLGVPTEYVEYMMGHKLSTYSDISMKGIEFLRQIYASANLRIKQEKKASLTDVLKEIIRSRGEDPSKYLKSELIGGRAITSEEEEAEIYARAIWEMLRKQIVEEFIPTPELEKTFLKG